jgi:hypothetical protein
LVGRDTALAKAEAAILASYAGSADARALHRVVSAHLQVSYTPQGDQQLTWSIGVILKARNGRIDYFVVSVDAMSGSASIVGRG